MIGDDTLYRFRRREWIRANAGTRVGTAREVADTLGREFDQLVEVCAPRLHWIAASGAILDAMNGRPWAPEQAALRSGDSAEVVRARATALARQRAREEDEQTRRRQQMAREAIEPTTLRRTLERIEGELCAIRRSLR